MGLDKETVLRISCPFGGGIGRRGETYGALMGAFMVIGLKFGSNKPKDEENKEKSFRVLNDVAEKFISRQGSHLSSIRRVCSRDSGGNAVTIPYRTRWRFTKYNSSSASRIITNSYPVWRKYKYLTAFHRL